MAKTQAKAAREEAKQQSINCAAEFEHADLVNKDIVNATPCPPFTRKPACSWKNPSPISILESSDSNITMPDNFERAQYVEKPANDDSAVDRDDNSAVDGNDDSAVNKNDSSVKDEPTVRGTPLCLHHLMLAWHRLTLVIITISLIEMANRWSHHGQPQNSSYHTIFLFYFI
jgi:hypothetical protein